MGLFGFGNGKAKKCLYCGTTGMLDMKIEGRYFDDDQLIAAFGVMVYYVAGIHDADTARKVIDEYYKVFPDIQREYFYNRVQEYYNYARIISENLIVKYGANSLIHIIHDHAAMLIEKTYLPNNPAVQQQLEDELTNLYFNIQAVR